MLTDSATQDATPHGQGTGSSRVWVAAVALLALFSVVALAVWHVWFNYQLKAWSDPLNWLRFARNLETEFFTSMFPVGYPLFLRAALDMLGPYLVFFANLPLVILYAVLGAWIAARAFSESRPGMGALPVLAFASACILACDPAMVVFLTNPYRDPLSYVYLFGSILLFHDFVARKPHRFWRLACSGALFGAAYSVREPSILMAGTMGLCFLAYRSGDREMSLWKAAAVFIAAALAGASPLIAQSLASHGGLLPPQISSGDIQTSSGIHPGDMALFRRNVGGMMDSIGGAVRWLSVPFLIGTVYAVVDRSRLMLTVVLPGALMYGVFYLFYNTFVHRYYYVVLLLAAIAASYGVCRLLADAGRLAGRLLTGRRIAVLMAPAAAIAMAAAGTVYAARQLMPHGRRPPAFRMADAREFAATLSRHIPSAGEPVIICRRNLCELIEWFGNAVSYDTPFFHKVDPPARLGALKAHIDGLIAAGRPVYFIDFARNDTDASDSGPLSHLFDFVHFRDIPLGHCVPAEWGMGLAPVYTIRPPANAHAAITVTSPPAQGGWIEARPGLLWGSDPARSSAVLKVDGVAASERLPNGFSVFPLPGRHRDRPDLTVTLDSDRPFASAGPLRVRTFGDTLSYDFNYFATPFPERVHGEGVVYPDPKYRPYPAFVSNAFVKLTAPLPPPGMLRVMEVTLSTTVGESPLADRARFLVGGSEIAVLDVPRTCEDREVEVALDGSAGEEFTIELRRQPGREGEPPAVKRWSDMPDALFLKRIRFAYLDPAPVSQVCRMGAVGDSLMIRWGFWQAERFPNGMQGRWTTRSARLRLRMAPPAGDAVLSLVASTRLRHPGAGPANLRVICNGYQLEMAAKAGDPASGFETTECVVPQALLGATNEVEIACAPWRPGDFGSADTRELGVVVHSLAIRAKAAADR